jgi:hypothetical protein
MLTGDAPLNLPATLKLVALDEETDAGPRSSARSGDAFMLLVRARQADHSHSGFADIMARAEKQTTTWKPSPKKNNDESRPVHADVTRISGKYFDRNQNFS